MDKRAQEMMWLTGNNKRLSVIGYRLSANTETPLPAGRQGTPNTERAFTFVELMVTVVILAVGLVLIIQGFITAADTLNTTKNHRIVMQFLGAKMQEIEAAAIIDNGIKRENSQGEFFSETRNFTWNLEMVAVEESEDLDLSEDLNEVTLKVAWAERSSPRDLSLVTYMRNKKNE